MIYRITAAMTLLLMVACSERGAPDAATPPNTDVVAVPEVNVPPSDPAAAPAPAPDSPEPAEPDEPADWPIFRGDRSLRGVAKGSLPETLELLWTFEAGQSIASSPVVADGRVYFGSDDGSLYAVDLKTGEKVWSFATEDIIEGAAFAHDDAVFFGSSDFHVYAVEAATGELRWKFETDDQVLGGANWVPAPDGSGSRIVVGCYDNRLYCLDSRTGELAWTYETDNYVNGTPVVDGDRIIFGGCDAAVHVVSASGEPMTTIPLCDECHIPGSVALDDGQIFFGHYGNAFVCVDLDTQEVRWTYANPRHPFFSSPAVGEDVVVFGGRDKKLHCVGREDGEARWTYKTRRKIDGSPVICGDKVVFGSVDGSLHMVRLADGEALWTYDVGQSLFSSPAVADGTVLIGCNDGRLYAFGAP